MPKKKANQTITYSEFKKLLNQQTLVILNAVNGRVEKLDRKINKPKLQTDRLELRMVKKSN